jgi:proton-translocating NAD(P)+ transhydrogenase subunit beta
VRDFFIQISYLAASVCFILGLRSLTKPDKARSGVQLAGVGMLLAIAGTLANHQIVDYRWIVAGLIIGTILGYPLGMWVPMTAMPQRIALSLTFSALAAALVGIAEYYTQLHMPGGGELGYAKTAALGFEIILGSVTVGGTLIAAGKLQEVLTSKPVTFRGQNIVNAALFVGIMGLLVYLVMHPLQSWAFYTMIVAAFVFGLLLVLPIGGADMPVVVALLNSYSGLASCATGFALGNVILIISGSLDGASGFILSILMSKAMNRSFSNVLFGAFGSNEGGKVASTAEARSVRSISVEDAAVQLAYAQLVVVIPGYGMAVAQAQHQVRELVELIEKRGGEVKFAVHPVAGRMPGHLNVILSEAGIDYDRLLTDVDDANAVLQRADVAMVIGANDIVNPAALDEPGSPIYGMPVLMPWTSRTTMVVKRGMASGFAGIDNPLFYRDNTVMLFGDAKRVAADLVSEIKGMSDSH